MSARGLVGHALAAAAGAAVALAACHRDPLPDSSAPGGEAAPPASIEVVARRLPAAATSAAGSASASSSRAAESAALASASAATSASASATPLASGSALASASASAPRPVDPQNRSKPPLESDELTASARRLFEAIKADDPSIARDVFFPREPFIPLKDVKNAGKYWDQLYRTYENDIHQLHRKRGRELANAEFESFALGSTPTWVKPGEEANKIGYYRTFNAKLRYRVDGSSRTIDVKVFISWADRWYITHLLPWKH